MTDIPQTTLDYLETVTPGQRAALLTLRAQIRRAAPQAAEYLGYAIPAFRQDGALVSFGATRTKCSFYVQSPAVMAAFAEALAGLDTSKGTIRFTPEQGLPDDLVTALVTARLAENAAKKAGR